MKKILLTLWSLAMVTTVFAAPSITNAPQSRAIRAGDKVTFVVGAGGTSLTYQWSFNAAPIAGASAPFYTLANAQSANAGTYSVLVTDSTNGTATASST